MSITVDDILDSTWEVKRKVGRGTFCEFFVAKNIHTNEVVAIKTQNTNIEGPVLKYEGDVLRSLAGLCGVPKFIHSGQIDGKQDFLVMELLGGEDMGKLRNRLRAQSGTVITLPMGVYFTQEILRLLKDLHGAGYVHRDVKPSNFVRETYDSHIFRMIDFGVTKQFKDKDGKLKAKRDKAEFRGTSFYASINSHNLEDLSPRDDLWSMVYVLFDLISGSLPWSDAAKERNKEAVKASKEKYVSQPEMMFDWIKTHRSDIDFTETARSNCLKLLEHLTGLKYEDIPDYGLIESCLIGLLKGDFVPSTDFDLRGGENNYKVVESLSVKQKQKILTHKAKIIRRVYKKALGESDDVDTMISRFGPIVTEKNTFELGKKVVELCSALLALKEADITLTTVESFSSLLKSTRRLFNCDLGKDDLLWPEFIKMQKIIQQFVQLKEIVHDRPPEIVSFSKASDSDPKRRKL